MQTFVRETKGDRPVVAICYDFDKTLSPDDMQAQGFIQEVYGDDIPAFWGEVQKMANANDMDQTLAYMYWMKRCAEGKVVFTKKKLEEYGAKVELFPGVASWFERINAIGDREGIQVEHYIISSGLKEMIEATEPARKGAFKRVYACSFFYDESTGVAVWPAQVVNYTNKTQFLFRIIKGVLDVNDPAVNDHFDPSEIRVPFTNMVYIGDSVTDIPCMRLVNGYGGFSIGVYNPDTNDTSRVERMMEEDRIGYYAAADYSEGSEIETLLAKIIHQVKAQEDLKAMHEKCVAGE